MIVIHYLVKHLVHNLGIRKVIGHREAIVRLRQSGMKPLTIAKRLIIEKATAYRSLYQWKQTGSIEEKPKSGRNSTVNT